MSPRPGRRWLKGGWAAMEVLLFGGLVYGWPSLVFLLKERHVYRHLCLNHTDVLAAPAHFSNVDNGDQLMYPTDTSNLPSYGDQMHLINASNLPSYKGGRSFSTDASSGRGNPLYTNDISKANASKYGNHLHVSRDKGFQGANSNPSDISPSSNVKLPSNDSSSSSSSSSSSYSSSSFSSRAFSEPSPESQTKHSESETSLGANVFKLDRPNPPVPATFLNPTSTPTHVVGDSGNPSDLEGGNSSGTAEWRGENCDTQDAAFALAYTVVTAIQAVGSLLIGYLQRVAGIRKARVVFGLLYVAGLLMVGFVTPERPVLLLTGSACVAVAGLSLLVTNVQLGAYFGRGQSTFVGVLSGCYDVSAISQLLIKGVISAGVGYLHTYIGVAILSGLTMVSALLWLPNGPVVKMTKPVVKEKTTIVREDAPTVITENLTEAAKLPTSYVTSHSLLTCLTSPLFLLHVLWFSVLQLRLLFFVGVFNKWLTSLAEGDLQEVDHFTSVQMYTGCSSLAFALLAGLFYDQQTQRHKKSASRERRLLGGAVLPLVVGSVLCTALSGLVLVRDTRLLYLTFLLLAAFRSVMYGLCAAFLFATFPVELYGVLYGATIILAGVLGCLQYLLFLWSEQSPQAIQHVNTCLLAVSLLTFLHPLHLVCKCRRSPPPSPSPSHPPASRTTVANDRYDGSGTAEDSSLGLLDGQGMEKHSGDLDV